MRLLEEFLPIGKSLKKLSENNLPTTQFGLAERRRLHSWWRAEQTDRSIASLRIGAVLCYTTAVRHLSVRDHRAIQGAVENEAFENGLVLLCDSCWSG